MSKPISDFGEKHVISAFLSALVEPFRDSYKFDDCAIIPVRGDTQLLLSTDQGPSKTFLEILGIGSPADIGHYHVTINVSDIAAMGGSPFCYVMALVLAYDTEASFLESYLLGIKQANEEYGIRLLGGDTKEGEDFRNTITILGNSSGDKILGRHLAQEGQDLYVTGLLGRTLSNYIDIARHENVKTRLDPVRPKAKVEIGKHLAASNKCNCCMDISDGLFASAEEIGMASKVSIELDLDNLPISTPTYGVKDSNDWKNFILNVGGDSDLLFTLDNNDSSLAEEVGALKVGKIYSSENGFYGLKKKNFEQKGYFFSPWEHFKTSKKISADIRSFV